MRLLTALCVAILAVAFSVPAFAATQNVKISGDITIAHIAQNDLDLDSDDTDGAGNGTSDSDNYFMQIVGINIEADLTDNISTFIRLVNQRDLNDVGGGSDDFRINLDEAYITMNEFLYAPLTVKVGRQNIWFGKGMIIGNNFRTWDNDGTIRNDELSDLTAFDAARATLDYDPWTVDLVYAMIDENTVNSNDDIDLYGINIGYILDKYDAEVEAYLWSQHDQSAKNSVDTDELHTIGLRGSFIPYEHLDIWGEGAFQFGKWHDTNPIAANREALNQKDREAWMINIGANYEFADIKWTPDFGIEWIAFSGDEAGTTGDYEGWNQMYLGRYSSLIRAYMDQIAIPYAQTDSYNFTTGGRSNINRLAGTTNQHQLKLSANVDFMEDLTLDADFSFFWFDEDITVGGGDSEIGQELDGYLTYDYTEDVQFKVAGGIFWPDNYYDGQNSTDDVATKLISAIKVDF